MIPELKKPSRWKTFLVVAIILGASVVPLYLGFSYAFDTLHGPVTVRIVSTIDVTANTTQTLYKVQTVTSTVTMTNSSG